MANYKIGVQKTLKGEFRVVLFSADNGKLVLAGEAQKNRKDTEDLMFDLAHNAPWTVVLKLIPATKKWPKNSGPRSTKKK